MTEYGLIGYPLTHSFSPAYFNRKFKEGKIDAVYHAFPLEKIDSIKQLLADHPNLKGMNVTIPYKGSVIPLLNSIDDAALQIGAVNCISIEGGITKGHNTDVIGFKQSLLPLLKPQHKHALVLGTGGAAKAVTHVLGELGINYKMVSRDTPGLSRYTDLDDDTIAKHKLIINTTPLGMYPRTDECPPISYSAIGHDHLLFDLIYNPAETKFLANGKAQGAAIKNGFEMLELQAEASWQIWTHNYPTV